MRPSTDAIAQGDLGRTPFAQLLAFTIERRLGGTLYLVAPDGAEHVVAFESGEPTKVRAPDGFARLGELLVEDGAVDPGTLEQALATPGLLGDVLLLGEAVTPAALASAVGRQLRARIGRLFALPDATAWAFFEGPGELDHWGGEPAHVDPIELLWAGVRAHEATLAPAIDAALAKLGDAPLGASVAGPVDRIELDAGERAVIAALRREPSSPSRLIVSGVAPEAVVRRVLYGLLLTRALGGVEANAPPPAAPPPSAPPSRPTSSRPPASASSTEEPISSATLARMSLRAEVHRDGAAAPDRAGDGERMPVAPRKPRKDLEPARPRLPAIEALAVASDRAAAGNPGAAFEALGDALAADPDNPDYRAFGVWLRAELPRADLKPLTIELDELCALHPTHVPSRYYRAALRARLGNGAGAESDARRVLELDPGHAAAQKLLASVAAPEKPASKGGLFARLFKR